MAFETSISALVDQYQGWMKAEGVSLGSADEHLFDEALTEKQREWLWGFSKQWDLVWGLENQLRDRLKVTDESLSRHTVTVDDMAPISLLTFAVENADTLEVLDELLAGEIGQPVALARQGGHVNAVLRR